MLVIAMKRKNNIENIVKDILACPPQQLCNAQNIALVLLFSNNLLRDLKLVIKKCHPDRCKNCSSQELFHVIVKIYKTLKQFL